jgi:hypothetical protein
MWIELRWMDHLPNLRGHADPAGARNDGHQSGGSLRTCIQKLAMKKGASKSRGAISKLGVSKAQNGNLGRPPLPMPGRPFMPPAPPIAANFFIIFIMPPPFIFLIMPRI